MDSKEVKRREKMSVIYDEKIRGRMKVKRSIKMMGGRSTEFSSV